MTYTPDIAKERFPSLFHEYAVIDKMFKSVVDIDVGQLKTGYASLGDNVGQNNLDMLYIASDERVVEFSAPTNKVIKNYWCPLNFKRHDKTLRNASKHVVADSFFKTKPPLIK